MRRSVYARIPQTRSAPWVVGPGILWNGFFHLGATLASRAYCPGAVTGVLVYVPLALVLARLVVREGLLGPAALLVAFAVALPYTSSKSGTTSSSAGDAACRGLVPSDRDRRRLDGASGSAGLRR